MQYSRWVVDTNEISPGRRALGGCGLAAAIALGAGLLLLALVAVGGVFFLRSGGTPDGPAGFPEPNYSVEFREVNGVRPQLWANIGGENCIGVTVDGDDAGVCRDGSIIVHDMAAGGQLWVVSLSPVGVALEPTDLDCQAQHHDIVNGINLSWCLL